MIRRLTTRQHVHSWSGFGILGCETFKWLKRRGIHLSLRAMAMDEKFDSKIPVEMKAALVHQPQPEPWELMIHTPEQGPSPGKKTALFTMFESTELAPKYVQMINRSDVIVVPCEWNKKHFESSGIAKPIYVVPLGIDPEIFTPQPIIKKGPCVFGIAGRTAHCALRKGIQAGIDIFIRTFPESLGEDVRLHVKIHEDCQINPVKDSRVKVVQSNMETYEIARWLHGLTAFVSLARSEGWGLWQHQAMACGRPVIACKYSGTADFLMDDFAVPFREVPADSRGSITNVDYRGFWAEPDEKAAAAHMRRIYDWHRCGKPALDEAGRQAASRALEFTWESATDKLIAVLEKEGVWK